MGNDCGSDSFKDFTKERVDLEKFYVYRSLNNDESWGAVVLSSSLSKIPNIDFGMKIFARNETEAISRAKNEYDKIHKYDSDKENIRRFCSAALRALIVSGITDAVEISKLSLKYALEMNRVYSEYFKEIDDRNTSVLPEW